MTSEGSAHGRFERAIASGLLIHADAAARELGGLALADALAFVALLAEHDDPRFARAASRWRARLEEEVGPLSLGDAHLAGAALLALRTEACATALATLAAVLRAYRVPAEAALRPLLARWSAP